MTMHAAVFMVESTPRVTTAIINEFGALPADRPKNFCGDPRGIKLSNRACDPRRPSQPSDPDPGRSKAPFPNERQRILLVLRGTRMEVRTATVR